MKPGFPIEVLALKADVLPRDLTGLIGFSKGIAPNLVAETISPWLSANSSGAPFTSLWKYSTRIGRPALLADK